MILHFFVSGNGGGKVRMLLDFSTVGTALGGGRGRVVCCESGAWAAGGGEWRESKAHRQGSLTASIIIQPDHARGCTIPRRANATIQKNVACSSFMIDGSARFGEKK